MAAAVVLVIPPAVWFAFNGLSASHSAEHTFGLVDRVHGPLALLMVTGSLWVLATVFAAIGGLLCRWPPWRIAVLMAVAGAISTLVAIMSPILTRSSGSIGGVPDLVEPATSRRVDVLDPDGRLIGVYPFVLRHPTVDRLGWAPRRDQVDYWACVWERNLYGVPLRWIEAGPDSWSSRSEFLRAVLPGLLRDGSVRPVRLGMTTAFVAITLLILTVLPGWIRVRHRMQRGECVACGYALVGGTLRCSECGTAQRAPATRSVESVCGRSEPSSATSSATSSAAWIWTVAIAVGPPFAWLLHNLSGWHAEWALRTHNPWQGPVAMLSVTAAITAMLIAVAFVARPLDRRRLIRAVRLAVASVMTVIAIAVLTPVIAPPKPPELHDAAPATQRNRFGKTLASMQGAWVDGEFIVLERRMSDLHGVDLTTTAQAAHTHLWLWEEFGVPLRCFRYCLPPSERWPGRREFLFEWTPRILAVAHVDPTRLAINAAVVVVCIVVLDRLVGRVRRRPTARRGHHANETAVKLGDRP